MAEKKYKKRHKAKTSPHRKRRRSKLKSIRAFFITFFTLIFLLGVGAAGYAAWYGYDVISHAEPIDPKEIYTALELTSQIYDGNGNLLDEIYYDQDRKIATYEQLPENLKNAFIAIEDKTFWEHHGFNFKRIFGAIYDSLNGGRIGGTSTITQQLARNIFLEDKKEERSINRKLTEMYYAYEIEQELSKEDILTAYLNTIYLGYSCYGVDAASKKYFSKSVEDLSLEECAALAAIPQAPGEYSLLVNEEGEKTTELKKDLYVNDLSEDRRYLVLDLMAEQGLVSAEDAEAAKKPATEFINPSGQAQAATQSSFKDYVILAVQKDLMEAYDYTAEQAENIIYTKGIKIYSTLDPQAQSVITKEFKDGDNFPSAVDGKSKVEAAMVIVEVSTGQVKAMVGGRSSQGKGEMLFNRATSPRQPGSSLKPLTCYSPALQKSFEYQSEGKKFPFVDKGYDKQGKKNWGDYITTSSKVVDERMKVKGEIWPQNYGRYYSGNQTFRTALQLSINTCAVKLLVQDGIEYSMEMLHKYGITTAIDDISEPYNDVNLAALGLGAMTYGVTPLDMAAAYATFPRGGVRLSPVCYTKVLDNNGNVLLDGTPEEIRVLDEGVAWIMTDVLKSVVSKGIAGNAKISGEEPGGKTGTTNDNYDIWFDGFTPNAAAALWIGTDENVSMNAESSRAAALWSKIMSQVDVARGGQYNAMPSNVIKKNGEYYTKGTEPQDKEKDKDKDQNKYNQDQNNEDRSEEDNNDNND